MGTFKAKRKAKMPRKSLFFPSHRRTLGLFDRRDFRALGWDWLKD